MIYWEHVALSYKKQPVLMDVNLHLARGEALCLMGKNGVGKTTLLKIGAGLLKPQRGAVKCSCSVGFVPQDNGLLTELSVKDNLSLWSAAWNVPPTDFSRGDSLAAKAGLTPFLKQKTSRLSGGWQKRLALVCVLLGKPRVLLLDEPFAGLDLPAVEQLSHMLRSYVDAGGALLFSAHDVLSIAKTAQKALFLEKGVLSQAFPVSQDLNTLLQNNRFQSLFQ